MRPVISLTSDFGTVDHFVGTMKGVIAKICPEANVIDITHDVPAFNILDGALAIWPAWRFFPAGTVHVLVVDPGVGSERRPILARVGDHFFIAPDNGLLTLVLEDADSHKLAVELRELTNPSYALGTQSFTFHGRDVFAPAAAHLANQIDTGKTDLPAFGPHLENPYRLNISKPLRDPNGVLRGTILKVDRFGNLLTNLRASDAASLRDGHLRFQIGKHTITRLLKTYVAGEPHEPFVILGSSGLLEVAVNRGNAAHLLDVEAGQSWSVT